MDKQEQYDKYIEDPCRFSSLPLWKEQSFVRPQGLRVFHREEWAALSAEKRSFCGQTQRFFRVKHDLQEIPASPLPDGLQSMPVMCLDEEEQARVAGFIQACYPDIAFNRESATSLTRTPAFCPKLWLWIKDEQHKSLALGLCDADIRTGEGILEWIQVHPSARGQGIGSMLVCELLRRMKVMELSFATVSGDLDNLDNPLGLYRRCGFTGEDVWYISSKE